MEDIMQNKIKRFCFFIIATALLVGVSGCVTPYEPPPLPQSAWGDHYAFSYQPKGEIKPAASVPVTIAVVNPSYKVEDSVLAAELYRKIGKGLSASMGTDLASPPPGHFHRWMRLLIPIKRVRHLRLRRRSSLQWK